MRGKEKYLKAVAIIIAASLLCSVMPVLAQEGKSDNGAAYESNAPGTASDSDEAQPSETPIASDVQIADTPETDEPAATPAQDNIQPTDTLTANDVQPTGTVVDVTESEPTDENTGDDVEPYILDDYGFDDNGYPEEDRDALPSAPSSYSVSGIVQGSHNKLTVGTVFNFTVTTSNTSGMKYWMQTGYMDCKVTDNKDGTFKYTLTPTKETTGLTTYINFRVQSVDGEINELYTFTIEASKKPVTYVSTTITIGDGSYNQGSVYFDTSHNN